jgi:hypothetical protein
MVGLRITPAQFEQLQEELVIRHRWDWPAVFSTNCHGRIWPYVCNGLTPEEDREYVEGQSSIVDEVASLLLDERPRGGRFFIDRNVACHKEPGFERPFVYFCLMR